MTRPGAGAPPTIRRPRGPHSPHDTLPSFMAALGMHALLVVGLWFTVQWRTNSPAPAVAELWAPLSPVELPPPPPPPAVEPQPQKAEPNADIVERQVVKPHAPDLPSPPPPERRANEKPEPRKPEPKKVEKKIEPTPQQIEREQKQAEQRREAEIARLAGQLTSTEKTQAGSTGTSRVTWQGLISACVKRNLNFVVPDNASDQAYAQFRVMLLPTGEQSNDAPPILVKSSNLPGFDDAAERAIRRCDPFPRDVDGSIPERTVNVIVRPVDAR